MIKKEIKNLLSNEVIVIGGGWELGEGGKKPKRFAKNESGDPDKKKKEKRRKKFWQKKMRCKFN